MRLFKYLHPDRIDVLQNKLIRFSSPTALNDPFELKPHIASIASDEYIEKEFDGKIVDLAIDELKKNNPIINFIPKKLLESLAKTYLPNIKEQFKADLGSFLPHMELMMTSKFNELVGILCLSESSDNLLMWAHYADSHRGFVIEFNPASDFFNQRRTPNDEFCHLRKVIYKKDRPSLVLVEIDSFAPFLTKGEEWSYEKEWRMMLPLETSDAIHNNSGDLVHLFSFPASAILSVIFGCRMVSGQKNQIIEILSNSKEFSHVQCFQFEIDEKTYKLNSKPITR